MSDEPRKVVDFPDRHSIELQAATWAVRQGEELEPEDEAAFREWMNASERHRDSYHRLLAMWNEAAILEELDDIADSVEGPAPRPERWPLGSPGLLAGAAMLLLVVVLVLLRSPVGPETAGDAVERDYLTATGEQRTVDLEDGSTVRLNTGTALTVKLSSDTRSVRLIQGEAFFEVAPDARRPFTVASPAGSVRALGTAFSTRLRDRQVLEVTVSEGRVEVVPPPPRVVPTAAPPPLPAPPVELSAGMAATYSGQTPVVEPVTESELARRLSWRDGVVVFSGEPLSAVIDDLSRYTDLEIRIADPSIEALPVGGYFRVGEIDALLESLELVFGIRARRTASGDVVLARAE